MRIFIIVIISLLVLISDVIQQQFDIKRKARVIVDLMIMLISTICVYFYLYFDFEKDILKSVLYTLGYLFLGGVFFLILNLLDKNKESKIKSYEFDAIKYVKDSYEIKELLNIMSSTSFNLKIEIIKSGELYDKNYYSEIKISINDDTNKEVETIYIPIINCSKKNIYLEYIVELKNLNNLFEIVKTINPN